MPGVRSLVELASAACVKNVRLLEGVGYLPYENVRHLLMRVDSAKQLRRIELNSPQLDGQTGELWLRLIEKDFPIEFRAKAYKPQDPTKWFKVWEKYQRDHDKAIAESEANFRDAIVGIQQEKAKNTSKIVESRLLPRKVPTKRWGSGGGSGTLGNGALTFGGGSRTRTHNGASVMRKVRREVREIAAIHGSLSKVTPAGGQRAASSAVLKAPQAMINERRRAAQPEFKRLPPKAVTEHEERATFISDSEDGEDGDLFDADGDDEETAKRPKPVTFRSAAPKQAAAKPSAARSAATSLLKSRRQAGSSSSSTRPIPATKPRPIPSAPDPTKSSTSPSKPRPSVGGSGPSASAKQPSAAAPSTSSSSRPAAARASSPPSAISAQSPPRPPKRKAADIFMKPRKRNS
ncbi:elongin-A [Geosmithia morbida]|uniref:Elongin-A n=1 Tax=Geosmithia morbida TaxID=1094350 RepID=A0A9P5D5G4_9HYPO|nr:elongin-A [Geosmithia morbida]KAF4122464.1 elongin-A [Geosmithia morbida]